MAGGPTARAGRRRVEVGTRLAALSLASFLAVAALYLVTVRTAAGGMAVVVLGGPGTLRTIDRADFVTLGPRDGLAVTVAAVAVAVVAVMAVMLAALHDVSLDTPRPDGDDPDGGTGRGS